jgi:hypothetical protein
MNNDKGESMSQITSTNAIRKIVISGSLRFNKRYTMVPVHKVNRPKLEKAKLSPSIGTVRIDSNAKGAKSKKDLHGADRRPVIGTIFDLKERVNLDKSQRSPMGNHLSISISGRIGRK